MRRGEDSTKVNNILLRQSVLQSITYLQSKVYLQEKEVYELVRAFFKEYLGLDYEFTHEELLIELQNVFYDKNLEDEVLTFLRKISKVEYSDEEYPPAELKSLLDEFAKIVEKLIKKKSKGKSFFKKLIFWKEHEDEQIPVEKEEEEEIADVLQDMEEDVAVDKKKGLFGKDKKIPQHRIEKNHRKKQEEIVEELPPEENKVKEQPKIEEKAIQENKKVNNALLSVTQELNDHIEKNRSYSKVDAKTPMAKTEPDKQKNSVDDTFKINNPKEDKSSEIESKTEDKLIIEDNKKFEDENPDIEIPIPEENDDAFNNAIKEPKKDEKPKDLNHLLKQMKKDPSIGLYQEIQQKYSQLPAEEQKKYYKKVMDAYNKVNKK